MNAQREDCPESPVEVLQVAVPVGQIICRGEEILQRAKKIRRRIEGRVRNLQTDWPPQTTEDK
jgi:hypothetical protein